MEVNWTPFYELSDASVRKNVPRTPGVYTFWELKGGYWKCFYVGQALNLADRLLQHLSSQETNKHLKERLSKPNQRFRYTEVSKLGERNGILKYLYVTYSPDCNTEEIRGVAFPVNLP
ncbi:MAG: hypothetical protein HYY09_02770 [Firmicutes bacterium]|nr:hypothetical protein [Bacillota bacterium]